MSQSDIQIKMFMDILGNSSPDMSEFEIAELFREARKPNDKAGKEKLALLIRACHPDSRESFEKIVSRGVEILAEAEHYRSTQKSELANQRQRVDSMVQAQVRQSVQDTLRIEREALKKREQAVADLEAKLLAPNADAFAALREYLRTAGYPQSDAYDRATQVPSPIMGHASTFVAALIGNAQVHVHLGTNKDKAGVTS